MSNPTNNVSDTRGDLPVGPELDMLVAEKVMGWTDVLRDDNGRGCRGFPDPNAVRTYGHGGYPQPVPHYSENIAAAWKVVEKFQGHRYFQINIHPDRLAEPWHAQLGTGDACARTAPHAICLAALKAVAS